MSRHDLVLPDLGLDERPVTVSLWLVARGSQVREGDLVLEVLAGAATIDLPSPADGLLLKKLVCEGDHLVVGQRLAVIEDDSP